MFVLVTFIGTFLAMVGCRFKKECNEVFLLSHCQKQSPILTGDIALNLIAIKKFPLSEVRDLS